MIWIASSEKDTVNDDLEKRLGEAAEQAGLAFHFAKADRNSARLEGLFLRFAEVRLVAKRARSKQSPLNA